jgi:hypothetical protein
VEVPDSDEDFQTNTASSKKKKLPSPKNNIAKPPKEEPVKTPVKTPSPSAKKTAATGKKTPSPSPKKPIKDEVEVMDIEEEEEDIVVSKKKKPTPEKTTSKRSKALPSNISVEIEKVPQRKTVKIDPKEDNKPKEEPKPATKEGEPEKKKYVVVL